MFKDLGELQLYRSFYESVSAFNFLAVSTVVSIRL